MELNSQLSSNVPYLTETEYKVCELLSEGLSNRQIAGKLFISVSTVKTHLCNIYLKFNTHNRVQAALYFVTNYVY